MERIKRAELISSFEEFLTLSTMTLATVSPEGEPHAAAVYFAADEAINLYYFSDASSQHSLDANQDPHAAVAIHPEAAEWQEIRGLQMRGSIWAVESKQEWQAAWRVYREKFPFVDGLKEVIAVNHLYVFRPNWIRLVDNRQGFGYRQEWEQDTAEGARHNSLTWRRSGNQDD
jgi:uncharacterized protein YhbP (UPF0306 family)